MRDISKSILAQISTGMTYILMNQKAYQKEDFKKGQLVYIPSNLICKNPNSLREALGYITKITNFRKLVHIINCRFFAVINSRNNANHMLLDGNQKSSHN